MGSTEDLIFASQQTSASCGNSPGLLVLCSTSDSGLQRQSHDGSFVSTCLGVIDVEILLQSLEEFVQIVEPEVTADG